jgi:hypothetical protein
MMRAEAGAAKRRVATLVRLYSVLSAHHFGHNGSGTAKPSAPCQLLRAALFCKLL